jgi:hypothetical protein
MPRWLEIGPIEVLEMSTANGRRLVVKAPVVRTNSAGVPRDATTQGLARFEVEALRDACNEFLGVRS